MGKLFKHSNLGTATGILDLLSNRRRGRHPEHVYAGPGSQGNRDGGKARFSLNNFIAKINDSNINGLWQPSRYVVEIYPGTGCSETVKTSTKDTRFLCNSASLPGVQIITSDHRRQNMGTFDRRPFGVQVTDIPLTFFIDQGGMILDLFRTWTNDIVNYAYTKSDGSGGGEHGSVSTTLPTGARHLFEVAYRSSYLCEIYIYCMDQKQENIIRYHLHEAFPMQVGDVTAAWSETDSFGILPVQFTFRTYDVEITDRDFYLNYKWS